MNKNQFEFNELLIQKWFLLLFVQLFGTQFTLNGPIEWARKQKEYYMYEMGQFRFDFEQMDESKRWGDGGGGKIWIFSSTINDITVWPTDEIQFKKPAAYWLSSFVSQMNWSNSIVAHNVSRMSDVCAGRVFTYVRCDVMVIRTERLHALCIRIEGKWL